MTPLMYAVKDNRTGILDRLVELGSDVGARNNVRFKYYFIRSNDFLPYLKNTTRLELISFFVSFVLLCFVLNKFCSNSYILFRGLVV